MVTAILGKSDQTSHCKQSKTHELWMEPDGGQDSSAMGNLHGQETDCSISHGDHNKILTRAWTSNKEKDEGNDGF